MIGGNTQSALKNTVLEVGMRSFGSMAFLGWLLSLALPSAAGAGPTGTLQGQVRINTPNHQTLADCSGVVVYLKEVNGNKGFAPPKDEPSMASKDMKFVPEVLPILVGTSVAFPNWDEVLHNAFSTSKTKIFDLGRYGYGESNEVHFTQTGTLNVLCKNHPKMAGYIVVLGNPYFTQTDKKGNYSLKNIPIGSYTLVTWFPYGAGQEKKVVLAAEGQKVVDFSLIKLRNVNSRKNMLSQDPKASKKGSPSTD